MQDPRVAYKQLGLPFDVYLKQYILPLAGAAVAATLVMAFVVAPIIPDYLDVPMTIMPGAFIAGVGVLLPVTLLEKRKHAIERSIHFYITRAGVLAKANLSTIAILQRLCNKEDFGVLAEETERIVFLVTRWNMSISEACRAVGKRSPSAIYADFLERLAYALDSGEDLAMFLEAEQNVVMEDFSTIYQGALYDIETLKGAFLSLAMSIVFLVVFGVVSPILTGFRAEDFMGYALMFFGVVDGIFLFLMLSKAPSDPVWHPKNEMVPKERVVRKIAPICVGLSAILAGLLFITHAVPLDLLIVVAMTPPVLLGVLVRREEAKVRKRDESYPAFVRALGSATSASGGVVRQVLKRLRAHNFGPLSQPVERLYRRLHLRVDDNGSWRAFAAESGSNLVSKFNAMFVEGTRAGGDPEAIGRIISNNYVRILNLRRHRTQTARSFRSTLLGFSAGMAFTMHVGLGVLAVLVHLFSGVGAAAANSLFSFNASDVNFATLALLVQAAIMLHSLMAAMMTQTVEGGSYFSGYVDFVILMWIAVLAGIVSDQVFNGFFGTGLSA